MTILHEHADRRAVLEEGFVEVFNAQVQLVRLERMTLKGWHMVASCGLDLPSLWYRWVTRA